MVMAKGFSTKSDDKIWLHIEVNGHGFKTHIQQLVFCTDNRDVYVFFSFK